MHAHATPLHHAALRGHLDVVRALVDRGARTDMRDAIYDATPLGWAQHGGRQEIVKWLASVSEVRGEK
jgi:ankyrin repeat protein